VEEHLRCLNVFMQRVHTVHAWLLWFPGLQPLWDYRQFPVNLWCDMLIWIRPAWLVFQRHITGWAALYRFALRLAEVLACGCGQPTTALLQWPHWPRHCSLTTDKRSSSCQVSRKYISPT